MASTMSPQPSPKRKTTAAGLPTGGRAVKRRAAKACHCCRSRKVRCDVVESGMPCTNCRLDEVACVVTEGKRRRKCPVDGEARHQSLAPSTDEAIDLPQFPCFDDIDGLNDLDPANTPAAALYGLDYDINHHQPHMIYQTQGHRLSPAEYVSRMSALGSRPLPSPAPAWWSQPIAASQQSPPPERPDVALPPFIRPISPRLMREDLDFLHRKGALLLPDPALRNELLRCFVQFVYPFLPLVDLGAVLNAIDKNDATDPVSLLLFQAIMFTGTAYIDMRYLLAQGYVTRRAARKAFFWRVKLLYDFDYETDRLSVVQAVLLMTYWYDGPDDLKDVWHWLGIAISMARTIGMNCDTSQAPSMSVAQRRLWKRVWWSCFMRDRLIALGMRRPVRIKPGDADVPMLELSDFETDALPAGLARMLGGCAVARDAAKRVTLAQMCIGLTKLCVCISQVLVVQYSTLGHKIGATHETTVRLVPKMTAAEPGEVVRCDRILEAWHRDLPPELHYGAPNAPSHNDGEVLHLHRALLAGIYLTALSALHRPQVLPSAPHVVIAPDLRGLSRGRVRRAANDVTDIFRDLHAHDLLRYVPNTGVTCLLPAVIIHLLDVKAADAAVRMTGLRKFHFCMQALQRLREMYSSADFAFSFLDAAVKKTRAEMSAAGDSHAADRQPTVAMGPPLGPKPYRAGPLLLTPPPEAMHTASLLMFNSTLTPDERSRLAAYTPPGSDRSVHTSTSMAGAAIALTDLDNTSHDAADVADAAHLDLVELTEDDFETLVDLEGVHDMFSTVNTSLDADANSQWLNGFDIPDDGTRLDGYSSLVTV